MWTRKRLVVLITCMFLALLVVACSKRDDKATSAEVTPIEDAQSQTDTEVGVSPAAGGEEGDVGEECKEHEYVLSPGFSGELQFHIKLPIHTCAALNEDEIGVEDLSISKDLSYWKKIGVIFTCEPCELDVVTETISLWGIRYPQELLDQYYERRKPDKTRYIAINDVVFGNKVVATALSNPDEGVCVITRIGEYRTAREVGNIDANTMEEMLNGDMSIVRNGIELQLEQLEMSQLSYYVTLNIVVTLPSSNNELNNGCDNYMYINGKKVLLRIFFDPDGDRMFHITGPWETEYCE